MELSKYNIYKKKENGLFIVNTLSGVVANIFDPSLLDIFKKLRKKEKIEIDENVKKLLDIGFLKENNVDEDIAVENIIRNYRKNELTLTLFTTRQCNFRCIYCYEKFSNQHLTKENFKSILKFINMYSIKHSVNKIRINLFGGEPLLNYQNIVSFLKDLNYLCNNMNIELSVGMTSNGYLLDSERYLTLYNLGLKDVQITLDGFEFDHNKKRYLINKEKTFKVITDNLDSICRKQCHSKILIRTNFDSESIQKEKDFLLYLHKRYGNHVVLHYEAIKKWNENYNQPVLEKNDEHNCVVELIEFCRENNINDSYQSNLSYGKLACIHAFESSFVIDANMKLLKCTVNLEDPNNIIGKMDNEGNVSFNNHFKAWKKFTQDCEQCPLLPMCLRARCPMQSKSCDSIDSCNKYVDIIDTNYNTKKVI